METVEDFSEDYTKLSVEKLIKMRDVARENVNQSKKALAEDREILSEIERKIMYAAEALKQ